MLLNNPAMTMIWHKVNSYAEYRQFESSFPQLEHHFCG